MSSSKHIPLSESSCYILLSVAASPKHGYAIMQHVKRMTDGNITIGNGTLYGTLVRMNDEGLIKIFFDGEKKKYQITDDGRKVLLAEKKRLDVLLKNINTICS